MRKYKSKLYAHPCAIALAILASAGIMNAEIQPNANISSDLNRNPVITYEALSSVKSLSNAIEQGQRLADAVDPQPSLKIGDTSPEWPYRWIAGGIAGSLLITPLILMKKNIDRYERNERRRDNVELQSPEQITKDALEIYDYFLIWGGRVSNLVSERNLPPIKASTRWSSVREARLKNYQELRVTTNRTVRAALRQLLEQIALQPTVVIERIVAAQTDHYGIANRAEQTADSTKYTHHMNVRTYELFCLLGIERAGRFLGRDPSVQFLTDIPMAWVRMRFLKSFR